jgi:hypothetical protein
MEATVIPLYEEAPHPTGAVGFVLEAVPTAFPPSCAVITLAPIEARAPVSAAITAATPWFARMSEPE